MIRRTVPAFSTSDSEHEAILASTMESDSALIGRDSARLETEPLTIPRQRYPSRFSRTLFDSAGFLVTCPFAAIQPRNSTMSPHYRHPDPAFIVETVVEEFLADGADLSVVTLDEFKGRLKRTICWMVDEFNETKIWPHRCNNTLRSVAV